MKDYLWLIKTNKGDFFCDDLVIVIGTVTDYEEVEPDTDLPEQDVFARLSVSGQSISISF